jgi:hypothetical protein
MKRPSLKRSKKQPTPQQVAAASAQPAAPAEKKPSRVRGGLGRVGRVLTAPVRLLTKLKGKARVVVWGVLAVIVVIAALQLRGGRDDEALVRDALARYEQASADKDYQTLCDDLFASSYVRERASSGLPCEVALRTALENVKNPTLDVISVEVSGDRAAARVRGSAAGQAPGEDVYTLIREDGTWRILPPRPEARTP